MVDIEYGDGIWVGVFDGAIASGTRTDSGANSTNDVIVDSVINSAILENTHYAFDPDYYL